MLKIAVIHWTDAAFNNSTWDRKELKTFSTVEMVTVGQFYEEREGCYVVCAEHNISEDTFRHIISIPKSCVKSINIVEVEDAEKHP